MESYSVWSFVTDFSPLTVMSQGSSVPAACSTSFFSLPNSIQWYGRSLLPAGCIRHPGERLEAEGLWGLVLVVIWRPETT